MKGVQLKGNPTNLDGSFLSINELAPDFALVNHSLENTTLQSFKHKRKLIATVPSIDTPVCSLETKELNLIAKNYPDIVVLVVSKDLPFAQKRFCAAEHLENVHLLSDIRSNSNFGKNYGVLISSGPLSGLLARSILLLNAHDKVIYSELVSEITNSPNFEALKQHLQG